MLIIKAARNANWRFFWFRMGNYAFTLLILKAAFDLGAVLFIVGLLWGVWVGGLAGFSKAWRMNGTSMRDEGSVRKYSGAPSHF